jgi:hypothetical protein
VAPISSQQEVRNMTIACHPSNQNRITPSPSHGTDELAVTPAGDDSA